VREHIAHVHIKDGVIGPKGEHVHVFPGEGDGDVKRILADLRATAYAGAFSIEPHIGIAPSYRDAATPDEGRYLTYVEYGRRLNALLDE
jgi:sugar phosphate isomerase/epimerase